jgi:hypothetical protein
VLIEDLIVNNAALDTDGHVVMAGAMKLVRIQQENRATHFYVALSLASDLAAFRRTFCILRDYAKFDIRQTFGQAAVGDGNGDGEYAFWAERLTRPRNTPPTWVADQYEHLKHLPCILILVQKGRMGDTFPSTFNCMDIRLSYAGNSSARIELSVLVQELGRLCRYSDPGLDAEQRLPYAIVSGLLERRLREALPNSLSLSSSFVRFPDGYLRARLGRARTLPDTVAKRWDFMEPTERHSDFVALGMPDRPPHSLRFVLTAEPQIGKTGTFLALLKLLSTATAGMKMVVDDPDVTMDEATPIDMRVWDWPHWRFMQQYRPPMQDQKVAPGKYDVRNPLEPGRPWRYGMLFPAAQALHQPAADASTLVPPAIATAMDEDGRSGGMRSRQPYAPTKYPHEAFDHAHTCRMQGCLGPNGPGAPEPQGMHLYLRRITEATGVGFPGQESTRVWLPRTLVNDHVLVTAPAARRSADDFVPRPQPGERTIQYWILTPSVRPNRSLLNLHHALNGQTAEQMVFCRPEHEAAFRQRWGTRKILVILPRTMQLPAQPGGAAEPCEVVSVEDGVGYARLFMQLVAETFGMPYVFMMDDNIFHMAELTLPLQPRDPTAARPVYATEQCALGRVLRHLQTPAVQAQVLVPPVAWTFPSLAAGGRGHHDTARVVDLAQHPDPWLGPAGAANDLEAYMGPMDQYALLGTFRCDYLPTTAIPFKRGHVYSLCLLNVNATRHAGVRFKSWPFWEDLNFNEQCNEAGLWVCKFNRFFQLKRWQPLPHHPPQAAGNALFTWPPSSTYVWPMTTVPIAGQVAVLTATIVDMIMRQELAGLWQTHATVVVRFANEFEGLWAQLVAQLEAPFRMMPFEQDDFGFAGIDQTQLMFISAVPVAANAAWDVGNVQRNHARIFLRRAAACLLRAGDHVSEVHITMLLCTTSERYEGDARDMCFYIWDNLYEQATDAARSVHGDPLWTVTVPRETFHVRTQAEPGLQQETTMFMVQLTLVKTVTSTAITMQGNARGPATAQPIVRALGEHDRRLPAAGHASLDQGDGGRRGVTPVVHLDDSQEGPGAHPAAARADSDNVSGADSSDTENNSGSSDVLARGAAPMQVDHTDAATGGKRRHPTSGNSDSDVPLATWENNYTMPDGAIRQRSIVQEAVREYASQMQVTGRPASEAARGDLVVDDRAYTPEEAASMWRERHRAKRRKQQQEYRASKKARQYGGA